VRKRQETVSNNTALCRVECCGVSLDSQEMPFNGHFTRIRYLLLNVNVLTRATLPLTATSSFIAR
jgi:hypothetical protein